MRSVVWTGHLHFGLVAMPVSLYAAARAETTRFRRIHRRKKPLSAAMPGSLSYLQPSRAYDGSDSYAGDPRLEMPLPNAEYGYAPDEHAHGSARNLHAADLGVGSTVAEYEYAPVRQVLQSEATGEEIGPHELVKGYEYGPNQFAVIEPGAIDRAAVETSDTIDLFHFVKADEVDPICFERSYYVAPDTGGEKAYALLLEAMRKEGYFGVARIGMHKREHMLILRPAEKCMVAHTMFYVNEVRSVPEFELDRSLINEREMSMASALINGYSGGFEPEKFQDIYQERIKSIIHDELSRTTNEGPATEVRSEAIVPDLLESIRLSLAQITPGQANHKAEQPKKSARASKSPAKKNSEKVPA